MKKPTLAGSTLLILLFMVAQVSARPVAESPNVVAADFLTHLQTSGYLSDSAIAAMNHEIEEHINCLRNWSDKDAYAKEHDLYHYLKEQRDSVSTYLGNADSMVSSFISRYRFSDTDTETTASDSLKALLNDKLGQIETLLNQLDREMNATADESMLKGIDWKTIAICAIIVLLAAVIYLLFRRKNNMPQQPVIPQNRQGTPAGNEAGIVVRRKTATILKKQSLENVIGNPAYLQIDAADFTFESAVRRIYIKNTCIIDIYNMYADDLQRPENPKEDGCMVLGRWVYDGESQEYYVSLEQIVLPGDDAVFSEYELNFGGKIKLKVVEQLRKLRRETNFQYDLTCWVHSHPGLGVFFSNSDVSVQTQLKHPTHPNFLTAIVVDILTPDMELGVFTFRRDGNINSQNELKRMYSLTEWYEWAIANCEETDEEVPVTKDDDLFDTLKDAQRHVNTCEAIKLNREMIVDMCMSTTGQSKGLIGLVHGQSRQQGTKTACFAERLSNNDSVAGMSLIGCLVADDHRSIPSIKKAVANYLDSVRFVMTFSPADGKLTSIPVVDGDLSTDESLYGEQQLDHLKRWRR